MRHPGADMPILVIISWGMRTMLAGPNAMTRTVWVRLADFLFRQIPGASVARA